MVTLSSTDPQERMPCSVVIVAIAVATEDAVTADALVWSEKTMRKASTFRTPAPWLAGSCARALELFAPICARRAGESPSSAPLPLPPLPLPPPPLPEPPRRPIAPHVVGKPRDARCAATDASRRSSARAAAAALCGNDATAPPTVHDTPSPVAPLPLPLLLAHTCESASTVSVPFARSPCNGYPSAPRGRRRAERMSTSTERPSASVAVTE